MSALGGLLAHAGERVCVLEAREQPGGMAALPMEQVARLAQLAAVSRRCGRTVGA